nr:MAG: ORF7 protein [Wenzhou bat alphacoronavirus 1]
MEIELVFTLLFLVNLTAEVLYSLFKVFTDCIHTGQFVAIADGHWLDANAVCLLSHPHLLFVLLLFSFFGVPFLCMMAWGDEVLEDYLNFVRRLHDRLICALFEASLFTIFLLASFLILTWSLGHSFL